MRKPDIKETVLQGAVPSELYRVLADHAPDKKATVGQMQLKAIKRAVIVPYYTHRRRSTPQKTKEPTPT